MSKMTKKKQERKREERKNGLVKPQKSVNNENICTKKATGRKEIIRDARIVFPLKQ
jgi:hypothetical protein